MKLILLLASAFALFLLLGCTARPPPSVDIGSALQAQIVCSSNDPAKIMLKAHNLSKSGTLVSSMPLGTIKLTNLTGGTLTGISCTGSNAFAENVPGCPSSVASGTDIDLTPIAGSIGSHSYSSIEINYTDAFGFNKSATISCGGEITIS
ncbi:MAG: hypothetical protein Q8N60_05645 [Candidatus Diapherotrites archaeon]|nr:hypothetical protein [Candidatus Diapherotrites archaeon]